MKPGEKFERDAIGYLNEKYSDNNRIKFIGGDTSDSTKSDIEVVIDGDTRFFIEAKDAAAQAGQFVLLPDTDAKAFIFSEKNKSEPDEFTRQMTAYMNKNFDKYNNAGTKGESLDIDNSIFAKWIKRHYEEKRVLFFITKKNNYAIFPIGKFEEYFTVSASYRIKKSGSTSPSKKNIEAVKDKILSIYHSAVFSQEGKKAFASIDEDVSQEIFVVGKYRYKLSEKQNGKYEIRQLSNTCNKNVIFSLKVKKEQDAEDLLAFKKALGIM